MINIKKEIDRLDKKFVDQFKDIPPSDYGHKLHYNLISLNSIKPVNKVENRFAGQAITVRITPHDSILVYKAIELAQPGDVLVIDMSGEERYACWGEVTTLAAKAKGVVATIVNGPATDSLEIEKNNYTVYATNTSPMTTKVHGFDGDINIPVSIDGVVVNPGDLIVGDNDGILVIPKNEAEFYLEIGKDELNKDQARKISLESISIDDYLKNVNSFLDDKEINWF
ncbi:RraA family protein [Oceanobacillus indicireducens]|uniref:Putative 4-hydroxy-4-methyl-2-oxoglutarate aldolase n=1 Tax=Oceanobacillus indicireducens TaxID=1004261 RepID=A0A917Y0K3_9BACI|nr:RraA family protein [Oceanobacillus indicireducens]GGN59663.1 S-adenosylmethionine--2-demethylmenaquinone methyltransferase [Oceanobacillus indicireducens]